MWFGGFIIQHQIRPESKPRTCRILVRKWPCHSQPTRSITPILDLNLSPQQRAHRVTRACADSALARALETLNARQCPYKFAQKVLVRRVAVLVEDFTAGTSVDPLWSAGGQTNYVGGPRRLFGRRLPMSLAVAGSVSALATMSRLWFSHLFRVLICMCCLFVVNLVSFILCLCCCLCHHELPRAPHAPQNSFKPRNAS